MKGICFNQKIRVYPSEDACGAFKPILSEERTTDSDYGVGCVYFFLLYRKKHHFLSEKSRMVSSGKENDTRG